MPTKSTGCATCRKRKIRCDEARPGCERCKVHGVVCGGYRLPEKGKVLFVEERAVGKGRGKKGGSVVSLSVEGSTPDSGGGTGEREVVWDFNDGAQVLGFDAIGLGMEDFGMGTGTGGGGFDLNAMIVNAMPTATGSPKQVHPCDDGLNGFWFKDRNGSPMDITRAMELYATPAIIHSPVMEKQIIYSTFMDTYLPQRIGEQDAHFSFLQQLIQTPNLRPEVSAGLDAMSLVQVGSIFKDQNLLKQAVKAYHKAISGLLKTFQSKETDFATDDYVLATVNVLANCEFFDEISQIGDGWTKHIEGQQQLLAARGPASIQSNLSLLLYSNMRHGALSHALLVRKACFMGTAEWRSVAWRAPYVDAATIFYDSALQVPAILERHDRLTAEDGVEKIDAILKDATKLEQEMRTWFGDYQIRSKWNEHKLFELAPIEVFETFANLCSDRTLEEAYVFPTFMVSYLICVYWDVMHFLRTTMQKLHMAKHKRDTNWYPEAEDEVQEAELREYVLNLCRCFPYFCEPVSSSTGQIGMFLPLRTVAFYFMEHGDWKMLKWCGAVKDNVFVKGMHPPTVQKARDPSKGQGPRSAAIKTLEDMPGKSWDVNRRPGSAEALHLVQALQHSGAPHPALQHPDQPSPQDLLT